MASVLLLALLTFAGWAVSVYLYPFRHCRRCGGSGRKKPTALARRRFDLCPRCVGTGRVQRIGSRTAHRSILSVRAEIARERQRRRDRQVGADPAHRP